jgi:hypothetical protein
MLSRPLSTRLLTERNRLHNVQCFGHVCAAGDRAEETLRETRPSWPFVARVRCGTSRSVAIARPSSRHGRWAASGLGKRGLCVMQFSIDPLNAVGRKSKLLIQSLGRFPHIFEFREASDCKGRTVIGTLYRPRMLGHHVEAYAARAAVESWFCRTALGGRNPCRSISHAAL